MRIKVWGIRPFRSNPQWSLWETIADVISLVDPYVETGNGNIKYTQNMQFYWWMNMTEECLRLVQEGLASLGKFVVEENDALVPVEAWKPTRDGCEPEPSLLHRAIYKSSGLWTRYGRAHSDGPKRLE